MLTNPHNPTGRVFTVDGTPGACRRSIEEAGALVFADEIHAPLIYPGGHPHRPYAALSAEHGRAHRHRARQRPRAGTSPAWPARRSSCPRIRHAGDDGPELNPFALVRGDSTRRGRHHRRLYRRDSDHLAEVVDYLRVGRDLFTDRSARSLPEARLLRWRVPISAWLDLRDIGCDPADVAGRTLVRGVDGSSVAPRDSSGSIWRCRIIC